MGGSELGWVEHQAHPPPLGHCPRDVINLKNAPTLGHSQAPPPLDIARVTSSTYSKGGTKLLKGGTKLLKGGTKLLKGGTKSLGWATGGGVVRPPRPPPGYGPVRVSLNSLYYCSDVSITGVSVITTFFEVFRLFQFVNKIRCTENYLELHETKNIYMATLLIKD